MFQVLIEDILQSFIYQVLHYDMRIKWHIFRSFSYLNEKAISIKTYHKVWYPNRKQRNFSMLREGSNFQT